MILDIALILLWLAAVYRVRVTHAGDLRSANRYPCRRRRRRSWIVVLAFPLVYLDALVGTRGTELNAGLHRPAMCRTRQGHTGAMQFPAKGQLGLGVPAVAGRSWTRAV